MLIPRPRIRDTRPRELHFAVELPPFPGHGGSIVPETKFETKRALKGEAETSLHRKWRTFLNGGWKKLEKEKEREKEV